MASHRYAFSHGSSARTLSRKETTIKFYNKKEIIWQPVYQLSVHTFLNVSPVSAKLKGKKYANSLTPPWTAQRLPATPLICPQSIDSRQSPMLRYLQQALKAMLVLLCWKRAMAATQEWFGLERKQNLLKRETVTCSKCFPTAWEVARVWPVTCVSAFVYLE